MGQSHRFTSWPRSSGQRAPLYPKRSVPPQVSGCPDPSSHSTKTMAERVRKDTKHGAWRPRSQSRASWEKSVDPGRTFLSEESEKLAGGTQPASCPVRAPTRLSPLTGWFFFSIASVFFPMRSRVWQPGDNSTVESLRAIPLCRGMHEKYKSPPLRTGTRPGARGPRLPWGPSAGPRPHGWPEHPPPGAGVRGRDARPSH